MSGMQTFEPDGIYCVHCHAPAAGPCAACGALCCGDCVELRPGLTRQQAVCRVCIAAAPAPRRRHRVVVAAVALSLLALSFLTLRCWLAA